MTEWLLNTLISFLLRYKGCAATSCGAGLLLRYLMWPVTTQKTKPKPVLWEFRGCYDCSTTGTDRTWTGCGCFTAVGWELFFLLNLPISKQAALEVTQIQLSLMRNNEKTLICVMLLKVYLVLGLFSKTHSQRQSQEVWYWELYHLGLRTHTSGSVMGNTLPRLLGKSHDSHKHTCVLLLMPEATLG